MQRKTITTLILAGSLVTVAMFGVFTYRSVQAQAETPTPETPAQIDPLNEPLMGHRVGRLGTGDEDLAAALGIDVDELQAARETAAAEALEQAVAEGIITQEQADQFAERDGERGFGGKGFMRSSTIDYDALLADALGISVDELQAAQQQAVAAGIDRAVEEGMLTQEQADLMKARNALYADENFQSNLQSAYESAVQQAVSDGVITQEQADQILAEQNGMGFFGHGGFGGFEAFGGHGRGPRGGWDGNPPTPEGGATVSPDGGV